MSDMMTAGEADEIKNSSFWGFITKELNYRIGLKTAELRRCKDQDKLDKLNAVIDTLEDISKLPEHVIERES